MDNIDLARFAIRLLVELREYRKLGTCSEIERRLNQETLALSHVETLELKANKEDS